MKRTLPILLLAAASCRPGPVKTADMRPLPSAAEALAELQSSESSRRSLAAMGRVTYFGEEGRVRLRAVIVVERPGRFRLETLTPLEQPIDVMTSDGSRIWLLSGGKLREGPATPENIARIIPVPLRAEDLVDAMLGGIPTGERFTASSISWADEDHTRWRLVLDGAGGERATLVVDPETKRVESVAMARADGVERLRVAFDKFEAAEGAGELPRRIKLEIPDRDTEVTIKLKEVTVNGAIDPALFRLRAPPGVPTELLVSPPVVLPAEE